MMPAIQHICVIGSGYDVHTRNRTQIFSSLGYKITFVTESTSGLENIEEILIAPSKNWMLDQFWGTLKFVRVIRNIDADVYLIHFPRRNSSWAAAIANVYPMTVSVMGGDVNFEEYGAPLSRFQQEMTLAVLEKSDFIFSQTHYLTSVMKNIGIPENKIERIIWGIDVHHWYKRDNQTIDLLQNQLNIMCDDYILFSPKMMLPFYNIHIIVDAFLQVLKKFPNAKLILSERRADLEYRQQIMDQIEANNLQEHVILVGDIPHDQMPTYYSLSDVVVTLASNDGLPHAMLEAMACEVPYVLGDLPRYREFVQHKEHVYCVDFNTQSVADGIIELLSHDELRTQMTTNAKELVYDIADLEKEAKRVIGFLERLEIDPAAKLKKIDTKLLRRFIFLGLQQFIFKLFKSRT